MIKRLFFSMLFLSALSSCTAKMDQQEGYEIRKEGDKVMWLQPCAFWLPRPSCYDEYQVEGADAKSFAALNGFYGKDSTRAYYRDEPILAADPLSFTALSSVYAKDNQHAYHDGFVIEGAEAASFRLLDPDRLSDPRNVRFARDANDIYFWGQALEACSADSFRDLGDKWQIDDKCVYYDGEKLSGADSSSFSMINPAYSKDRNHVYYRGEKLSGADPASFSVIMNAYYYGKDQNHVYRDDEVIDACSVDSFHALDDTWQVDDKCAYFQGNKLSDADPSSFSVISERYAKDRDHIYRHGEIISCEACAKDAHCNKVVQPRPCPEKSK